jgi:acetyl esterase/lipase
MPLRAKIKMAIPKSQTLVYKRVDNVNIELDFFLPSSPSNVPVLLWFHGGGLLQGQRKSVAPHMLRGVEKHSYALISADYRLAPQASAAKILTDVTDCIKYIRNHLVNEAGLKEGEVNVSKIAVSGSSAGGYLALLAGLNAQPRPDVVLAIYPITDPLGSFFTNSQPHPDGKIDKSTVAPFLNPKANVMSGNPPENPRNKMYYYMMQEAILADLLCVREPDVEFRIAKALTERGIDRGVEVLPPIYVIHGDADKFVGVEQADEVVQVLKDMGAVVEYERLSGLDHLFDKEEKVDMDGMYAFMKKYI